MNSPFEQSDDLPVYVISVAAELSGMHPQTLREYERRGLVSPGRSGGGGRRYSMRDILALREIQRLSQDEGVNLSGIKLILSQLRELEQARRLIAELRAEIAQLRVELESTRGLGTRDGAVRRDRTAQRRQIAGHPAGTGRAAQTRQGAGRPAGAGRPEEIGNG
jgi:MerR family transcriptional regulator/heat shock protein HspR